MANERMYAAFLAAVLAGTALAATSVNLGTAKSFAVLAGTTITNTGSTTITGDVGLHPGDAVTGFADVTLHGAQHIGDAVASGAKDALVGAYNDAAGATPVNNVPTELGGTTLKPGVYASATLGLTGTLTLDGNGVYIFQAGSTLITAPGSSVRLTNGASACDVYWQVGSSATLDTTTSFKGTIMALTSIALNDSVTLEGRALARNGAVTMINDTIDSSSCTAPNATPAPRATAKPGGDLASDGDGPGDRHHPLDACRVRRQGLRDPPRPPRDRRGRVGRFAPLHRHPIPIARLISPSAPRASAPSRFNPTGRRSC